MTSDWWNCEETRQRARASSQERTAAQVKEINRAYKAAKIPGATPRHWLGKISRMNKLGRPMPKGLAHLAGSSVNQDTLAFIESGKQAARAYFASEYAAVRAQNIKRIQEKYAKTNAAKQSQAEGGSNSGVARKLKRDQAAMAIIDAYKSATARPASVKPVARLVADWYVKTLPSIQSLRAVTQMLQRAGVAT